MRPKGTIATAFVGIIMSVAATAAQSAELRFEKIVIDRGNAEGCSVVDVNGDGLLDIVSLPNWYRAPHWGERPVHPIRRSGEFLMNFGQIALDVNGDGAVDIISAGWFDKEIYWYENPKTFRRMGDEYKQWERHLFARPPKLGGGCETIFAVDIDGDGRTDVLPNQRPLGWYRIEKGPGGEPVFKRYPIDESGHREDEWQHGLGFGDINGDGRKDVLTNDAWWEAPRDPLKEKWIGHRDFRLHDASIPMIILDLDGDGDSDFIYGHGHNYGLYWMEQTQSGGKRKWVRHTIDKSLSQAHTLVWIDLDGDGKEELITGKRWRGHSGDDPGANDPMGIYYYKFDRAGKTWQKHVITHNERIGTGMQLQVVDIDKDGDLDIVAPGKSGLYLLKNVTEK